MGLTACSGLQAQRCRVRQRRASSSKHFDNSSTRRLLEYEHRQLPTRDLLPTCWFGLGFCGTTLHELRCYQRGIRYLQSRRERNQRSELNFVIREQWKSVQWQCILQQLHRCRQHYKYWVCSDVVWAGSILLVRLMFSSGSFARSLGMAEDMLAHREFLRRSSLCPLCYSWFVIVQREQRSIEMQVSFCRIYSSSIQVRRLVVVHHRRHLH